MKENNQIYDALKIAGILFSILLSLSLFNNFYFYISYLSKFNLSFIDILSYNDILITGSIISLENGKIILIALLVLCTISFPNYEKWALKITKCINNPSTKEKTNKLSNKNKVFLFILSMTPISIISGLYVVPEIKNIIFLFYHSNLSYYYFVLAVSIAVVPFVNTMYLNKKLNFNTTLVIQITLSFLMIKKNTSMQVEQMSKNLQTISLKSSNNIEYKDALLIFSGSSKTVIIKDKIIILNSNQIETIEFPETIQDKN